MFRVLQRLRSVLSRHTNLPKTQIADGSCLRPYLSYHCDRDSLHTFAGRSITTLSIIVQNYASYLNHDDKIGMVGGSFHRRFVFSEGLRVTIILSANVGAHETF
jgi:hypothetical protein